MSEERSHSARSFDGAIGESPLSSKNAPVLIGIVPFPMEHERYGKYIMDLLLLVELIFRLPQFKNGLNVQSAKTKLTFFKYLNVKPEEWIHSRRKKNSF